jgi:hypothetical protein
MLAVVALLSRIDHGLVEQWVQHRHSVPQTFVFPLEPRAVQRQKGGELGGGKFVIIVIIMGVVAGSRQSSHG